MYRSSAQIPLTVITKERDHDPIAVFTKRDLLTEEQSRWFISESISINRQPSIIADKIMIN